MKFGKPENLKLLILAFFFPMLMGIPGVIGYLSVMESDQVFLGFIRPDDFHRYASFIKQASTDNRFVFDEFSAVEGFNERVPAFFLGFLGLISRSFHISEIAVWMGMRVLVGASLLLVFWALSRQIFKSKKVAIYAFGFAAISGGLQWLFILLNQYAFDFHLLRSRQWWMDGMSTFELMHNPLKIAGMTGLVLSFIAVREYRNSKRALWGTIASIVMVFTWLTHPLTATVCFGTLWLVPVLSVMMKPKLKTLTREITLSIPLLPPVILSIATVLWMRLDPVNIHTISAHRYVIGSLPLYGYFIHYGAILPFACYGFYRIISERHSGWELIPAWFLAIILALNNQWVQPLLFQHTLHLPCCLSAAYGLHSLMVKFPYLNRIKSIILGLLITLFSLQLLFDIGAISGQTLRDVWPSSLYMNDNDRILCRRLLSEPDGNVLSHEDTGNKIAWLAQKRVLLGHWGTTPERRKKQIIVRRFFKPNTSLPWKLRILKKYDIAYIFWGRKEQQMGILDKRLPLIEIHRAGQSILFKFVDDSGQ